MDAMTKDQAKDILNLNNRIVETELALHSAQKQRDKARQDLDSYLHALQYPPKGQ